MTTDADRSWSANGVSHDSLVIQCGPAKEHRKRLVIARLGKYEHTDRFDTDDAFKREKFRSTVVNRFCLEENAHEAIEQQILAKAEAEDSRADGGLRPDLIRMSDVAPEAVIPLWPNRINIGKLTLLVGDPGLGKSFLTLYAAAQVTTGRPWPDALNDRQPVGGVVLLSAEDDLGDTIRVRLDAHEADVSRIVAIQGIKGSDVDGDYERGLDLARDIEHLRTAIDSVENCRLVVIDPISAYLGRCDSHKNAEVRSVLKPLADLAAEKRVAVLAVTHLRKGEGSAKHRTMGSMAFVAAARAAWLVTEDQTEPTRRLMLPIKNNLNTDSGGLAFCIRPYGPNGAPVVCWEQGTVDVTADDAIATEGRHRGPDAKERADAAKWLKEQLSDSPRAAKEIIAEADDCGFSKRTIQRAFNEIGGQREKRGFASGWWWSLAKVTTKVTEDSRPPLPGIIDPTWHLRENTEETQNYEDDKSTLSRKVPSSGTQEYADTFEGSDDVPF